MVALDLWFIHYYFQMGFVEMKASWDQYGRQDFLSYCKDSCQWAEAHFQCAPGQWHLKSKHRSKRGGERKTLIDWKKNIFSLSIIILHNSALFSDNCICNRGHCSLTTKSRKIKLQVLFLAHVQKKCMCVSFFFVLNIKMFIIIANGRLFCTQPRSC